jgi:hypothetical protein
VKARGILQLDELTTYNTVLSYLSEHPIALPCCLDIPFQDCRNIPTQDQASFSDPTVISVFLSEDLFLVLGNTNMMALKSYNAVIS